MNNQKYSKGLKKVYSIQFSNSAKKIPLGQIRYHKKNFTKFFNLKKKEFKKKVCFRYWSGTRRTFCYFGYDE